MASRRAKRQRVTHDLTTSHDMSGLENEASSSMMGTLGKASSSYTTPADHKAQQMQYALENVFGHTSFRPGQKRIVRAALSEKDVFVVMPTGGGKSLCYQLPAVIDKGLTVVISPLKSLIQDQVSSVVRVNNVGVPALYLR